MQKLQVHRQVLEDKEEEVTLYEKRQRGGIKYKIGRGRLVIHGCVR